MHHCLHFVFRQLHCTRVTIHKNLFLSYILYGMTWLLFRHLVPLEVAMESPVRPGKQRPLTYVKLHLIKFSFSQQLTYRLQTEVPTENISRYIQNPSITHLPELYMYIIAKISGLFSLQNGIQFTCTGNRKSFRYKWYHVRYKFHEKCIYKNYYIFILQIITPHTKSMCEMKYRIFR